MTLELGLGAVEVLASPGTGRVVAAFPKAAYLRLPAGLIGLTTLDVPPGAIHARTSVRLDGLRADDPVVVCDSLLQAAHVSLHVQGAQVWRGPLPSAAELTAVTGLAVDLLESAPPSSLRGVPDVELLWRGDLPTLANQLGGLGPGLTPAGDDCLAGILLIAHIRWGAAAADGLAAIAESVATNDVARAFLRWAALGQSIEPVHRFLVSAAKGDANTAAQAVGALVSFGHSSGADLALGLRLALHHLPGALRHVCDDVGAG